MIPLPPKIDPSVTMMQVEERPPITYDDVGGCKEQIEKLREVVELPLLDVSCRFRHDSQLIQPVSLIDLPTSVSSRQRVYCSTALQERARLCVRGQSPTGQTVLSSEVRLPLHRSLPLPSAAFGPTAFIQGPLC